MDVGRHDKRVESLISNVSKQLKHHKQFQKLEELERSRSPEMPSISTKSSDENYASLLDMHVWQIQTLKEQDQEKSKLIEQLRHQNQNQKDSLSTLWKDLSNLKIERDLFKRGLDTSPF